MSAADGKVDSSGALRVSVIVCTRDRAASLRETLASIQAVEVPEDWAVEVLVVDNGSTDETQQVVDQARSGPLPIRSVMESRPGVARARNRALGEAAGEILVFTDDDVRVPSVWLREMVEPIHRGECDALAGRVRLADHLRRPWLVRGRERWLAVADGEGEPVLVGASMSLARSVLRLVPGFDPNLGPGALGLGEESLFYSQIKAAGCAVRWAAAEAEVVHWCDESRVELASLEAHAEKLGRSFGFIAHHWEHAPLGPSARKLLRESAVLVFHAVLRRDPGPAALRSRMLTVRLRWHYLRQQLRERKRPRRYEYRGLVPRPGAE